MSLAERIAACEQRWSITVEARFTGGLPQNFVAPAGDYVLKLGKPGDPELTSEAAALRAWAGQGAVRLVDADLELRALLLERVRPGTNLVELEDESAIAIVIELAQRLHVTPPADVWPLDEWTSGIERAKAAGFAPPLIDRAVSLRAELLASAPAEVLLHGDLHHENVLASGERYVAIDPKGVAGDPAYEPSVFLYNPFDQVDVVKVKRRIDRFGEVFDRERVAAWAYVQARPPCRPEFGIVREPNERARVLMRSGNAAM
jgi:streptomycin 6-kinase